MANEPLKLIELTFTLKDDSCFFTHEIMAEGDQRYRTDGQFLSLYLTP